MYKLYRAKGSGSIAPQAMFEEAGAEYQMVDVDFDAELPSDLLVANPLGQVPTVVLPDGTILTESAALVLHIGERHPESDLVPAAGAAGRAAFCRWLLFMATSIYSGVLRFVYADRQSTDANAADGIKAAAVRDLARYFDTLEGAIDPGPYLLGDRYSAVDMYLWMLSGWQPDQDALFARCPRVKKLVDLVAARPAIARVKADNAE